MSESILEEAARLVNRERADTHGGADGLTAVAQLWNFYLSGRGKLTSNVNVDAEDVAAMMMFLKLARLTVGGTKRDHLTDACGYAQLIAWHAGLD